MSQDPVIRTFLGLCTAILVFAGLYFARTIFAPVTFSLFIIAIVWPFQSRLQTRLPKLLALAITVLAILIVIGILGYLVVWGFSKIGVWAIGNSTRFQALYMQATDWLEGHGITLVNEITGGFGVGWIFRAVQEIGGRLNSLISFAVITFVFTVLGLLEVDVTQKIVERLERNEMSRSVLRASADIASKFRKYMLVRTVMSVLTGAVVWAVALLAGLELATAWGVIAFVLNYIPFIGPLIATVFPTIFAIAQFESWRLAVIVFLSLNLIQFLIGSYFEPRMAGAALSVSPFIILFAVFFWSFLWGIPGAFIGVPVVIAFLTICQEHESTLWIAELLSGGKKMS
jgi:predicted PurR-regulated permease PerM